MNEMKLFLVLRFRFRLEPFFISLTTCMYPKILHKFTWLCLPSPHRYKFKRHDCQKQGKNQELSEAFFVFGSMIFFVCVSVFMMDFSSRPRGVEEKEMWSFEISCRVEKMVEIYENAIFFHLSCAAQNSSRVLLFENEGVWKVNKK